MFKTTLKARLLAAATLTGVTMGATAVWAQEAAPVSTVDEVIVTAQLREQKTIDVPFALTAYSGQFLENWAFRSSTSCRPSCRASWSRTSRRTIRAS